MSRVRNVLLALIVLLSRECYCAVFSNIQMYYPETEAIALGEKFRLCRIDSNNAVPIYSNKRIKVFFKEDEDKISSRYEKKLNVFMSKLPKHTVELSIEGHADQCGDYGYNKDLSLRRATNVWNKIKHQVPRGIKILGEVHGEADSHDHSRDDKYVELTVKYIKKRKFKQVILLDISGSLDPRLYGHTDSGYTVEGLKNFKFKTGSIAYVARDMRYQCTGTKLKKYKPVGDDYYNHARYLIGDQLRGPKINGYLFTDYGDIRRNRSIELELKKIGSYKKILWHIL